MSPRKPKDCRGCVFYGDGWGFVPDSLNDNAEVFIFGQNPGGSEEAGSRWTGAVYEDTDPQPFIEKTGLEMERIYFPQAGLDRSQISLGNAIRCRYNHTDEVPQISRVITQEALKHCHNAYFRLPAKTKVIVALGELALFALTQEGQEKHRGLSDWRGYALPFNPIGENRVLRSDIWSGADSNCLPVLATYHIAYTFRDPTARLITQWDWRKVPKLLKRTWPGKLPPIVDGPPDVWPRVSAFDSEYVPDVRKFLCYSLYDGKTLRVSEELDSVIISPETTHTVIMHNASADLPFLDQMLPADQLRYEDTMHAHAVLWSDFPHDLNFLGSMYGSINRWKHLDQINPKMYSAADAFATWEAWQGLSEELERDSQSKPVYEIQKKLIPIIMKSEETGILINPARAREAYREREAKCVELSTKAQAIAGWPINIRSNKQAGHHLFEVERLLRVL